MTDIRENADYHRGYARGFALGAREVLKDIHRFLDEEYSAFEEMFIEAGLEVERK